MFKDKQGSVLYILRLDICGTRASPPPFHLSPPHTHTSCILSHVTAMAPASTGRKPAQVLTEHRPLAARSACQQLSNPENLTLARFLPVWARDTVSITQRNSETGVTCMRWGLSLMKDVVALSSSVFTCARVNIEIISCGCRPDSSISFSVVPLLLWF